jgi:hypothetical protein
MSSEARGKIRLGAQFEHRPMAAGAVSAAKLRDLDAVIGAQDARVRCGRRHRSGGGADKLSP